MSALVRREHLAVLSGVLTALCVVPYLRDIRRGTTRPHRVSWFVFAALSVLAAASQFAAGSSGAWLSAGSAVGFTTVFVVSIRQGEGGASHVDRGALGVAAIGITVWAVTQRPIVALVAVVVAELAAVSLTVGKAVRDPASETVATWAVDGVAGVAAVVAVTSVTFSDILYPVHHTLVNAAVLAAVAYGRGRDRPRARSLTAVG